MVENETFSYEYTSKTNILLLSLTDFCPYFCSISDLNGKQFRDVKKREIMSPFNMHFNVTKMIELVNQGEIPSVNDLVFKKFKKTEISLDWTLLKLSFQDLKLLKQIGDFNLKLIKERIEAEELKQAEYEEDEENLSSSYSSMSDSDGSCSDPDNYGINTKEYRRDVQGIVNEEHAQIGPHTPDIRPARPRFPATGTPGENYGS